ncbi:hypothetical protein KDRO_E09110 [Kluyveromyces lactis]|nr:hypothetical protein KDRO_E09110 [Kluyveromyces lactis]
MSGYASVNETPNLEDEVDGHFRWLDAIRVLFGVLLASQLTVKCVSGCWWFPTFDWWSPVGTPGIGSGYWSTHNYTIPYNFTLQELSRFSGDNSKSNEQPILLAINRTVFDVSSSPRFYGTWGAYKKFTGTDCSNNFQFGIFDYHAYSTPCHWDVSGFDESQMAKLAEWYRFFESKYPSVGMVILETDIEDRILA